MDQVAPKYTPSPASTLPVMMSCQSPFEVKNATAIGHSIVVWEESDTGNVYISTSKPGLEEDSHEDYRTDPVMFIPREGGNGAQVPLNVKTHNFGAAIANGAVVAFTSTHKEGNQIVPTVQTQIFYARPEDNFIEELRQIGEGQPFHHVRIQGLGNKTLGEWGRFKVAEGSPLSAHVTFDNSHNPKQIKIYFYPAALPATGKKGAGMEVLWCTINNDGVEGGWKHKVLKH